MNPNKKSEILKYYLKNWPRNKIIKKSIKMLSFIKQQTLDSIKFEWRRPEVTSFSENKEKSSKFVEKF